MSDLLFACLTCLQAPEKLTQQNPLSSQASCTAAADRHPHSSPNPTAAEPDRCISKPEVMVSLTVARADSPQPNRPEQSVRLVSSTLASRPLPEAPTRSVSPGWSERSAAPDSAAPNSAAPNSAAKFLMRGNQSQSVVQLQRRLQQLGYPVGPIDGLFGVQTQSAVRAFQRSQGLKVDGVAGPETLAALKQKTASPTAEQSTPEPNSPADIPSPKSGKSADNQGAIGSAEPSQIAEPGTQKVPQAVPAPPKVEQPDLIALAPFGSLSIVGWIVLWAGGWLVIMGSALRDQQRYRTEPPKTEPPKTEPPKTEPFDQPRRPEATEIAYPATSPHTSAPVVAAPPRHQTAGTGISILEEEETVMVFALGEQDNPYYYVLLEDADGLFVMRDNELRLKPQRLVDADAIETTVTLRRTDIQGHSIEQSFSFQFQKAHQSDYAA